MSKSQSSSYKVSIIVPCYNTRPWLDECLQSLVNQTLQEVEIICVNDGSTDGTGKRLDEWQIKYPDKIKVIHQANGGLSNARNAGMKTAQGECIGFVDSDDFVDTCMYEKLYKVFKDNHADSVRCNFLCFNDGEYIKKQTKKSSSVEIKALQEDIHTSIFKAGYFFTCGYLHKKYFLDNNNIKFQSDIKLGENYTFSFDISICNPTVFKTEEKLYYYRQGRYGKLTSSTNKNLYNIFKIYDYINNKKHISFLSKKTYHVFIVKFIKLGALNLKAADNKYKINLLFTFSHFIFRDHTIAYIYKQILSLKYRKLSSYYLALIWISLLTCCYLFTKLPFVKIKDFNSLD